MNLKMPYLNMSKDRIGESCCSDGLESKSISMEEWPAGLTKSKGGNLPSAMCKWRNLDEWANEGSSGNSHNSNATFRHHKVRKNSFSGSKSMSNKKNKRNLSSQPTIKSFFRQPESKTGDAEINGLVTSVDTVVYQKTSSVQLLPAEDQDNSNISCSLSTDKCKVATLEWPRIQQRMKMTLPLCKGHREPCIPRSVKKGSNIGCLFYVCACAQGPASNSEANCGSFSGHL